MVYLWEMFFESKEQREISWLIILVKNSQTSSVLWTVIRVTVPFLVPKPSPQHFLEVYLVLIKPSNFRDTLFLSFSLVVVISVLVSLKWSQKIVVVILYNNFSNPWCMVTN